MRVLNFKITKYCFLISIFCLMVSCSNDSTNTIEDPEKLYWKGTVEDIQQLQLNNPNYIGVGIILNKEASLNFDKIYTKEDFKEISIDMLVESSFSITAQAKKQIEAEKSGDKSGIQIYEDSGRLVNISNFRRIIFILLKDNSPQEMFAAIKILEKRNDVIWAGPNVPADRLIGKTLGFITISGSFESLSIETEEVIRQAYLDKYKDEYNNYPPSYIDIMPDYFGTYGDGVVVLGGYGDIDAMGQYIVAGVSFESPTPGFIDVFKDGKGYPLLEAYELGLLEKEDIKNIAYFYNGKRHLDFSPEDLTVKYWMPSSFSNYSPSLSDININTKIGEIK